MTKINILYTLTLILLVSCANNVIKVIETIPPAPYPEWVRQYAERWETGERIFFRTSGEGYSTLTEAQEAASAMAKKKIVEEISSSIMSLETIDIHAVKNSESGNFINGRNKVNYSSNENISIHDFKSIISSVINSVQAGGIIINEMYIEHIAQKKNGAVDVYYRVYVLASISMGDYKKIGNSVFENAEKTNADRGTGIVLKKMQQEWNTRLTEK